MNELKMNRKIFAACIIVFFLAGFFSLTSCSTNEDTKEGKIVDSVGLAKTPKSLVNTYVRDFGLSNKAVVLEYHGVCKSAKPSTLYDYVGFPSVIVKRPPAEATGLHAFRDVFSKAGNVRVAKSKNDVIMLRVGNIWKDFLDARIHRLYLEKYERNSPVWAIRALLYSRDIRDVAKRHRVQYTSKALFAPFSPFDKGKVLPAKVTAISVGEFLEMIAKAFGGTVVYGTCLRGDGTHLVDIGFSGYMAPADPDTLCVNMSSYTWCVRYRRFQGHGERSI